MFKMERNISEGIQIINSYRNDIKSEILKQYFVFGFRVKLLNIL